MHELAKVHPVLIIEAGDVIAVGRFQIVFVHSGSPSWLGVKAFAKGTQPQYHKQPKPNHRSHHSCRAHLAQTANLNSSIRINACSSAPSAPTNGTLLRLRRKTP